MKVIFVSLLLFGLTWGAKKVQPTVKTTTTPGANFNCECGKTNKGRIYAGLPTRKNVYTWMAALEKNKKHFCGGSIITQKHVLTAAHCFFDQEIKRQNIFVTSNVDVVVGGYDLTIENDHDAQRLKVNQIIFHELYSPCNDYNDIAIVVTAKKIAYNTNVGPICMPIEPLKANLTNEPVKVTGWGYTKNVDTPQRLKELREVELTVEDNAICNKKKTSRICARKQGKEVCKGDSGGALVWLHPTTQKFTQVGLVSNNINKECGKDTNPGIFTDVTAYFCWIDQQIWPMRGEVHTCHQI